MTALFALNSSQWASACLSFLQQEVIYTSIIFGIVLALTLFFRKASPYWHFGLWALVLVRFVLPPDFSSTLSLRYFLLEFAPSSGMSARLDAGELPSQKIMGWENSARDADLNEQPVLSGNFSRYFSWQNLLFAAWIAGCLIFIFIYLKQFEKYRQVIQRAQPVTDPKLLQIAADWRANFQIRRRVQLLTSSDFVSPFTIGVWRPRIFLPCLVIEKLAPELIEVMIAHEMVHIRQFDALWLKIQNLVQIVYFFHPVVWFANNRLCLARECICDHQVLLKSQIPARRYGQSILEILKLNLFGNEPGVLAGFGRSEQFKFRIQKLKRRTSMTKTKFAVILFSLATLGAFLLPMAARTVESDFLTVNSNEPEPAETESLDFVTPVQQSNISQPFGSWTNLKKPNAVISLTPLNDPAEREKLGISNKNQQIMHLEWVPGENFGMKIEPKQSAKVFAAMSGTVRKIDSRPNSPVNVVLVHENGWFTQYGPLEKVLVSEGQKVAAGDVIGRFKQSKKGDLALNFGFLRVQNLENEDELLRFDLSDTKIPREIVSMNWGAPLLQGRVSARFGLMKHPIDKERVVFHRGIDVAVKKGTPVLAAVDGQVSAAEVNYQENKGAGKHLILDHANGCQTFYSHLDTLLVAEGQSVKAGEEIARVGTTGMSTGPHLHFEIRSPNGPINPQHLVDFGKLAGK